MIEASRSVLEQHLAAQFEDGEPPLDKDLVNVTEIIEQLPQHLQGKASRNKVADTLETLGGQQLGKQAILPGGKKVRLWAMRRAEMYSTLTQHQLGKAYTKGARGSLAKFAAVKK